MNTRFKEKLQNFYPLSVRDTKNAGTSRVSALREFPSRMSKGNTRNFFTKKKIYTKLNSAIFLITFLFFSTLAISLIVGFYCDFFYDLGNHAKKRIIENPTLILIGTPILFWISAFICRKYASNASGFGLEKISDALTLLQKNPQDYKKISEFLSLRVAIIVVASSLLATFAGGSLGREGTSIQIATCLITGFGYFFRKYLKNISFENLIYAGCAIGIAVAFNSSAVGFFYVLEKFYKNKAKDPKSILLVFAICLLLSLILKDIPQIYFSRKINFNILQHFFYLIFLSIICALVAFLFHRSLVFLFKKFSEIKGKKWHFVPIIFGFATALIALYSGVYSVGGGIKTVNDALSSDYHVLKIPEVVGRIFSTIFTFAAGCSGGLVAPAIAIGAGIGSVFGSYIGDIESAVFIIGGMVAFLSPVLKAPTTSALLITVSAGQDLSSLPILVLVSFSTYFLYSILEKQIKPSEKNLK